jgi:ribonuclease HI
LVWRVGNGQHIRVWRDSWIPRGACCKVLTPKGNSRIRRVSELLDSHGNWHAARVRSTFLPIDSELILKIKPSRRGDDDVLAWQPEKSGIFSVRSAYRLALQSTPEQCDFPASSNFPGGENPCWSKIWSSNVPPKVKVFAWKAASNALATEANKLSRGMRVTGFCKICGREKEDTTHALYSCMHARQLWTSLRDVWLLPSDLDMQIDQSNWFCNIIIQIPVQMLDNTLLVAWRAWHVRNEVTHDKALPSIQSSRQFLCSYLNTLKNVRELPVDTILKGKSVALSTSSMSTTWYQKKKPPDKPWCPPSPGWVKLTVDGSYKVDDGSAGTGMILRDDSGQIIFSACRSLLLCVDALEAEIQACLEGLDLALHYSQLPIIIDTDCSQLVAAVQDHSLDRSPMMHLVSEIKRLSCLDRTCKFVKVDRSQIRVSHCLANFARAENQTDFWLGSGPDIMLQELGLERLVTLSE